VVPSCPSIQSVIYAKIYPKVGDKKLLGMKKRIPLLLLPHSTSKDIDSSAILLFPVSTN
jgi:hypothetical protein